MIVIVILAIVLIGGWMIRNGVTRRPTPGRRRTRRNIEDIRNSARGTRS